MTALNEVRGMEQASEARLAEHRPKLVAMLEWKIGLPHEEAEDAAQAAMLAGLRRLRSGRGGEVLDWGAWLRRVAVNAARKAARRRLPCDPVAVGSAAAREADEVAGADELDALRAAVGGLPDDLRQLLTYCTLERHTYREAVERFGICAGVVSRRLQRARETLKARMTAPAAGR
jgi:RNA polymerase sigma-70 factor (ECF subfamily)